MRCLTRIPFAFVLLTLHSDSAASSAGGGAEAQSIRITVVFNNVPHKPDLTTAWCDNFFNSGLGA